MDKNEPNPIDTHVGARVRLRRRALGISQESLANDLGLTFQQVQKYERGANRVSASKLYDIAKSLQAPISYFFDGLADPMSADGFAEAGPDAELHAFMMLPEGAELARLFPTIRRPRVRRKVLDLVRALADEEASQDGGEA